MSSELFISFLRWTYICTWGGVAGFHATAAIRSFRGPFKCRPHDPFWAMFCLTAINRLWLAGTWIFIIGSRLTPLSALYEVVGYLSGIAIAIVMIAMPLWYTEKP